MVIPCYSLPGDNRFFLGFNPSPFNEFHGYCIQYVSFVVWAMMHGMGSVVWCFAWFGWVVVVFLFPCYFGDRLISMGSINVLPCFGAYTCEYSNVVSTINHHFLMLIRKQGSTFGLNCVLILFSSHTVFWPCKSSHPVWFCSFLRFAICRAYKS